MSRSFRRTSPLLTWISRLVTFVALAACSGDNGPVTPENPIDSNLRFTVADSTYTYLACAGWIPRSPTVKRTVVDIRFNQAPGGAPPSKAPDLIHGVGGQIAYLFHLSTVRAALDVDSVAVLERKTGIEFIQTVVNPSDFVVSVNVTFNARATSSDVDAAKRLGAVDAYILPPDNMIRVIISDDLLPALKQMPGVTLVTWGTAWGCLV